MAKKTGPTIEEFFETLLAGVSFLNDQQGIGYVSFDVDGHREVWPCKSKNVRFWIAKEYLEHAGSLPSGEATKRIVEMLQSKALYEGEKITLNNRVGFHHGEIWYDLANDLWQGVRISSEDWFVDDLPILFRRYAHQKPQVYPDRFNKDVKKFLEYVNVSNPDHQLLLLVSLISAFIPDIAHPILIVHGPQGSAKSVLSKLNTLIIDPSRMEGANFPKHIPELVQMLNHHWATFFDNISSLSQEESDMLCRIVTGMGYSKRELYTDSDDIIWNFKRVIGLNGINQVANRPDLLERSLLIELERITEDKRKSEREMMESFEKDLPVILGGVFDTLVKAISIKENVKVERLPRMADFTLWGCAIAEALGFSQESFLLAYEGNIKHQDEAIIADNILANVLISFISHKKQWSGTPTLLLADLTNHAEWDMNLKLKGDTGFPKSPNWLSRDLNRLKVSLEKAGYKISNQVRSNSQRIIEISDLTQNTDTTVTDDESSDF